MRISSCFGNVQFQPKICQHPFSTEPFNLLMIVLSEKLLAQFINSVIGLYDIEAKLKSNQSWSWQFLVGFRGNAMCLDCFVLSPTLPPLFRQYALPTYRMINGCLFPSSANLEELQNEERREKENYKDQIEDLKAKCQEKQEIVNRSRCV